MLLVFCYKRSLYFVINVPCILLSMFLVFCYKCSLYFVVKKEAYMIECSLYFVAKKYVPCNIYVPCIL
jgi:hypothetical protein